MTNKLIEKQRTNGINKLIWNGMPRENLTTRVANAIREQIRSGKLQRGSRLQGEIEFSRELGVSRQTLREATRLLTREGLLTIKHGTGTFVAGGRSYLSSALDTMSSMSALIREHGGESRIDGLKIRKIDATEEVAEALGIPLFSPVAEIFRLRLNGEKPLAIAYDYIALLDDADWKLPLIKTFDGGSIYRFMETKLEKKLAFSEASLTAIAANSKQAKLMRIKLGFPLLLMREIQFETSERRSLYSMIYHHSSMVEFTIMRPGIK